MIKTFINLPVTDLDRSVAFYAELGMTNEPKFTDETAACMVLSDAIHVMLLTHPKFSEFTPRPIADARSATQVLNTFTLESREAVDELAARALAAGATEIRDPEDHGFMYGRSVDDPDGHIWEIFWIDETAVPVER